MNLKTSTILFFVILLAVLVAIAITAKAVAVYVGNESDSVTSNLNTLGAVANLFGKRKGG